MACAAPPRASRHARAAHGALARAAAAVAAAAARAAALRAAARTPRRARRKPTRTRSVRCAARRCAAHPGAPRRRWRRTCPTAPSRPLPSLTLTTTALSSTTERCCCFSTCAAAAPQQRSVLRCTSVLARMRSRLAACVRLAAADAWMLVDTHTVATRRTAPLLRARRSLLARAAGTHGWRKRAAQRTPPRAARLAQYLAVIAKIHVAALTVDATATEDR